MKKLFAFYGILTVLLISAWFLIPHQSTHAQNVALTPSTLTMASTAVAANCPAPAAGSTTYCFAADKLEVSPNGGPYVTIWPAGAVVAGVRTVNGKIPDASGNVTLTATASLTPVVVNSTATGPTVTVALQ